VPDHPVVLERVDGHAEWVNAKALEISGISAETRDPSGGKIERYADGRPSGILIDNAKSLVDEKEPPLDDEGDRAAVDHRRGEVVPVRALTGHAEEQ